MECENWVKAIIIFSVVDGWKSKILFVEGFSTISNFSRSVDNNIPSLKSKLVLQQIKLDQEGDLTKPIDDSILSNGNVKNSNGSAVDKVRLNDGLKKHMFPPYPPEAMNT